MTKENKIVKKGGFTLAELLVVVAIIAVLVAIAIPVFLGQLEKSRETVDITSMRNAYAEMSVDVITEESVDGVNASKATVSNPLYFDGSKLTTTVPSGFGKGTKTDGGTTFSKCSDYSYDPTLDYTNAYIICYFDSSAGVVHIHWANTVGSNTTDSNSSGGDANSGNTNNGASSPKNVTVLPTQSELEGGKTFSIKAGTFYSYQGKTYYVTSDQTFNQYYYVEPSSSSTWLYIAPTSKTLGPTDVSTDGTLTDLHTGNIYKDGDKVYLRKSDATHGTVPTTNSSEWYDISSLY